jgi:DNA (cytosine-5)-methyltransferase 1
MPKPRSHPKQPRRSAPTVVDLFSGAGGLSAGFVSAGYQVIGGLDSWRPASDSFAANKPDAYTWCGDITTHDAEEFASKLSGSVDVVLGGPSCQGFSTSSGLSRNGRKVNDPRNSLFRDFIRYVDALKPSWVVMENVPGLLLYQRGEVARAIHEEFSRIGYSVVPLILLAADFGVPQLRRRLFFVGNRTGQQISFPQPTHGDPDLWKDFALPFAHLSRLGNKNAGVKLKRHVSLRDAISDLPAILPGSEYPDGVYPQSAGSAFQRWARLGSRRLTLHRAGALSDSDAKSLPHIPPGGNWRDLPPSIRDVRFGRLRPYDATTMMRRTPWDRPSYTITTKSNDPTAGAFIHPEQHRAFSIREAARIQSFADSYHFVGSDSQIRELIGNAVPPLLAERIARAIAPEVFAAANVAFSESTPPRVTLEPTLSIDQLLGLTPESDATEPTLFDPIEEAASS